MLGKFGRTLAGRPGTQVHVAGRAAPLPPDLPANLHVHELLRGTRLSFDRLRAQWRYWQLLRRLQPAVVFVHAPELLPATVLWQRRHPECRFVYDVRENYALNIETQAVYPAWARGLLARLVRALETLAAGRAAAVVLAERSYARELPFATKAASVPEAPLVSARPEHSSNTTPFSQKPEAKNQKPTIILENKHQPYDALPPAYPRRLPPVTEQLRLVYSGTISALNGVWEAIRFTEHLRPSWPGGVQLTIVGFCQQPELLARLHAAVVASGGAVVLVGGAAPVPHARVVAELPGQPFGPAPLPAAPEHGPLHAHQAVFEYLAETLPLVLPPNPLWQPLAEAAGAGLVFDFQQDNYPPATSLVAALQAAVYYPQGPPATAFWHSEAEKLLRLLDSIR